MGLIDQIIGVESGGDPNAKNPLSSASGPGQFIDSTWLDTIKAARPDLAQGKSDADLLALKSDPQLSHEMTGAYAAQNAGILRNAGLPVTPGTQYLSHFAGPGGAVGLLNADPNAPAASILGAGFAKANPSLAGYTAGQLRAWADRKMGGGGGQAPMSIAGPAQPAQAPAQQQPTQQAPQQQAAPQASAPIDWASLAATPRLTNLLPQRANLPGVKLAPLSFGV